MKRKKYERADYLITTSSAQGRKNTILCEVGGCGYTSRVWRGFGPDATMSHNCPRHGNTMKSFGCKRRMPRKGSRKFKRLMKKLKNE